MTLKFDAFSYQNKPALGFTLVKTLTAWELWDQAGTPRTSPPTAGVIQSTAIAAASAGQLLVFDIEFMARTLENAHRMASILDIAYWAAPTVQTGIYGNTAAAFVTGGTKAAWDRWRAEQQVMNRIFQSADFVAMGLYITDTGKFLYWPTFALSLIVSQRRSNLPIYAFACPTYIPSTTPWPDLPSDQWAQVQNVIGNTCDGIVYWGGVSQTWPTTSAWTSTL